MLTKLRRKFIGISMSLVSFLLITIFASIYFLNYISIDKSTDAILFDAINEMQNISMDSINYKNPNYSPIFIYDITDEYKFIGSNLNIEIDSNSESEILQTIIRKFKTKGFIFEYGIKFYKFNTNESSNNYVALLFDERIIQLNNLKDNIILAFIITFIILFMITKYLASWALRPVENAWNFQKQFIADASHELKTPLTVILANLKILKGIKPSNTEQLKWLNNTNDEAIRMKYLIEEMLYLAKTEDTQDNINYDKVNFSELTEEVILTFESIAFEKGLKIKYDSFEENLTLVGDKKQLKRLVIILIDNACKYSETGNDITIELFGNNNKIYFKITSIGNIINKENSLKIFERFIRESESRSRNFEGGYGLGLAIAKKIVESHNGNIEWKPYKDIGNTFIVELEA